MDTKVEPKNDTHNFTKEDWRKVLSQYITLGSDFAKEDIAPREDLISGTELDNIMPIFKDSLTVISAPPKNGKSMFMLHLALNLAWNGNLILYLSLENSRRQDRERVDDACKTYGKEVSDFWNYVNIKDMTKFKTQAVENFIRYFGEFDAIFIDATEKITQMGETGSEISKYGREILDKLLNGKFDNENKPAIVCTWQYNKENLNNKIEDASLASLGGSISAVQMADNIWTILRDRKTKRWVAKLLTSREVVTDKDTFDVWDGKAFRLI